MISLVCTHYWRNNGNIKYLVKANHGKPRDVGEEKTDQNGLSVRVTQKGKLIFQIRYRFDGKLSRLDIGSYPLLSLKEARVENLRLKKELEQGYDPKIVRLLQKQAIMNGFIREPVYAVVWTILH